MEPSASPPVPTRTTPAWWLCRILLGFDCLVAAVILYFFLLGLSDGTVSSFNAGLWLIILASLAAIVGGGFVLHQAQRPVLGALLLSLLAVPGMLYGLFVLMFLLFPPSWN